MYINTPDSIFRDYYYHFHGDHGEILFLIKSRNRYEIDVLLLVLFRHTLICLQSLTLIYHTSMFEVNLHSMAVEFSKRIITNKAVNTQ